MSKNILLIATGSVAVQKLEQLYVLLKKRFNIKIIGSEYVRNNFNFSSIIKFEEEDTNLNTFPKHIELAKWADIMVVVPATANTIAKFNSGIADSQVLSTLLAARQPVILVPAMNSYMYSAIEKRGILSNLSDMGHVFIGPCVGKLREGETGIGRMVEPEKISELVGTLLSNSKKKNVLIAIGASKVYFDPIRYITNGATGKFGLLISNELRLLGHHVELLNISSYSNKEVVEIIKSKDIDIYISTAAFADFDILKFSNSKIKKGSINKIELKNNVDVLETVSSLGFDVYGFKLDNDKSNAIKKMNDLNLRGIIWNTTKAMGAEKITGSFILKNKEIEFKNMHKKEVAKIIAKEI